MNPGTYNIRPQRRADFVLSLVFKDNAGDEINLTGWAVLAQVWDKGRIEKYGDFEVDVIDAAAGAVSLTLPNTITEELPAEARYDVMLVNPSGLREYYLEGIVRPSEGYTAPTP